MVQNLNINSSSMTYIPVLSIIKENYYAAFLLHNFIIHRTVLAQRPLSAFWLATGEWKVTKSHHLVDNYPCQVPHYLEVIGQWLKIWCFTKLQMRSSTKRLWLVCV